MTKPITVKRQKKILKTSGSVIVGPKRDAWDNEETRPFKVVLKWPLRGFKKVYEEARYTGTQFVAHLEIPVGATVIMGHGGDYKLRASEAKVLSIQTVKKTRGINQAVSGYNGAFVYNVGKVAKPNKFDKSFKQCAGGIHFYLSRRQAERH